LTLALAALAAIGFGGSAVGARLGLRDTGIVAGVLIANTTAVVILVAVALIDPPPSIPLSPTGWFALSGLVGGPGLASLAILLGLRRLGPPTHVPLQGGSYGIVVSLGAALFLSETVGPRKALGVAAIVMGAGWLVRAQARAELVDPVPVAARTEEVHAEGARGEGLGRRPWSELARSIPGGWYLPLLAGAALATGDLIAKWQLRIFPYPSFGAAVGMMAGTLAWAASAGAVPGLRTHLRAGRHGRWFVVAGASLGVAYAALNTALNRGDASTVGPIVASEPLAAIVLSAIFLSRIHRVTKAMLAAACLVVAGAALVSS
jgi:drug/metabolite transporter (DMT)-like permease